MCGIFGATAQFAIDSILLNGLEKLEYRGYDSCGIAVIQNGQFQHIRGIHRIHALKKQISTMNFSGLTGIAHTRWATHGTPSIINAHPIISHNKIAVVHNGIIENFQSLKNNLENIGFCFETQTDTEVIAHLIYHHYTIHASLKQAVQQAIKKLKGTYAIAVISTEEPTCLIGVQAGSPLIIGIKNHAHFLTSDISALSGYTTDCIYLEEMDIAELTPNHINISNNNSDHIKRIKHSIPCQKETIKLGKYHHFMHKEIFEQPDAIADTLAKIQTFTPTAFGINADNILPHIKNIIILACGTSFYAGLCAKYWIEELANIPVQVEIASEYRYRISAIQLDTLVILVSQSGETTDTIAALKHAQSLGHINTLAICNVASSTLSRMTNLKFFTQAGKEISVASTKAFTTQLTALFLFAATLSVAQNKISATFADLLLFQLHNLPKIITHVLTLEQDIIQWSKQFATTEHALFLGRGLHYPVALEGALKLKETSYIHAEAYPAGELKHGPIALVTKTMPIITIAPNDALIEKLKINMQEVQARGGKLYVLSDASSSTEFEKQVNVVKMPNYYGLLSPIVYTIPLQLLAYHIACIRGTDVDKPRNLAKSVTVE